jgi:hypothetical protein
MNVREGANKEHESHSVHGCGCAWNLTDDCCAVQWERLETHKARRRAEQVALNEQFFSRGKKQVTEDDLGVDTAAPLLLDVGPSGSPAIERAKALHELIEQAKSSGEAEEQESAPKQAWAKRQLELESEAQTLNAVSREYHAKGEITVAGHRQATTADTWLEATNHSFLERYRLGLVTSPRKIFTGAHGDENGKGGKDSPRLKQPKIPSGLNAKLEGQIGLWCEEESLLLAAYCAVYGPDVQTITRLMCRGGSTGEIKLLINRACADTRCELCQSPEKAAEMILCDKCNQGYHIFCLAPPLTAIPDGAWYCEECQPIKQLPPAPPFEEGRELAVRGLEKQASDELQSSFFETDVYKVLEMLSSSPDAKSTKRRLMLRDIHKAAYTTCFGVYLLTCPIPLRNETVGAIVEPLRRHLRIIAHAVVEAFNTLDVLNVRGIVRQQHERKRPFLGVGGGFPDARVWVLYLNPQFAKVDMCKVVGAELGWVTRRQGHDCREGDKLYIWAGGQVSVSAVGELRPKGGGIVATAVVTSVPQVNPSANSPRVSGVTWHDTLGKAVPTGGEVR